MSKTGLPPRVPVDRVRRPYHDIPVMIEPDPFAPPDDHPISFILDKLLEPRQEHTFVVNEDLLTNYLGPEVPEVVPKNFVYRGDPGVWIDPRSSIGSVHFTQRAIPCSTYASGAPTEVGWGPFAVSREGANRFQLCVVNEHAQECVRFLARLVCHPWRPR